MKRFALTLLITVAAIGCDEDRERSQESRISNMVNGYFEAHSRINQLKERVDELEKAQIEREIAQ